MSARISHRRDTYSAATACQQKNKHKNIPRSNRGTLRTNSKANVPGTTAETQQKQANQEPALDYYTNTSI